MCDLCFVIPYVYYVQSVFGCTNEILNKHSLFYGHSVLLDLIPRYIVKLVARLIQYEAVVILTCAVLCLA